MKRKALFWTLVFVAALAAIFWSRPGSRGRADSADTNASGDSPQVNAWAEKIRTSNRGLREAMASDAKETAESANGAKPRQITDPVVIAKMVEVATARREAMRRLIRENPELALQEALGFAEYAALPAQIQALVERPFTQQTKLDVYPVCGDGHPLPPGTPDALRTLSFADGSSATPWPYGHRKEMMSKVSVPLTGIVLDGDAALHDRVLIPVTPADLAALGLTAPDRSIVTGQPVDGSVIAVAGGKAFAFTDEAERDETDRRLAALDAKPDPHISSNVLLTFEPQASSGPSSLSLFQVIGGAQANSTWTETTKRIFMVRVDTADLPGNPFTRAQVEAAFNGPTKSAVEEFSYGKTTITFTASENVYRLPQATVVYNRSDQPGFPGIGGDNGKLLLDARNTFRANKSGADASINIGPAGDGGGFGNYDIVGVIFADFNMRGSGVYYAGLAGGTNLWIQNTLDAGVLTHELGHNYGLGHSNRWDTTDGSIVGPGSSVEYGDSFDVMGGGGVPVDHFGSAQKSKLNWLTTADWLNQSTSQSIRLYGIDRGTSLINPRGVRMTKVATPGSEQYYWLTYRPRRTNNTAVTHGLHLAWVHGTHDLLDTRPATVGNISDAPLTLGRTFSDTTAGIHVTPLAIGGTAPDEYIDLRVNIGTFPGNAAPVATTLNGSTTVAARTSNNYSVSATDSNGDTLAYAWDTKDGVYRNSASSQSLSWTIGGTYTVDCVVSDMKGGTSTVSKTITVTDPLLTWTSSSFPGTTNPMRGLAWGEHRWVALGYFGEPYYSWDGVTWLSGSGSTGLTSGACHAAYGAGVFVAAGEGSAGGEDAAIAWSEDGRSWQTATFPATASRIEDVQYGANGFLAVTGEGYVFQSIDGKTWTRQLISGAPAFEHLTWEGSVWLAATSSTNKIFTSPDGLTWTDRFNTGIDVGGVFGFNGRSFLTGWYGGVRYSDDDGVTWNVAALPTGTNWGTSTVSRATDGTLVCTGIAIDESGMLSTILVSQDNGVTWARPATNQPAGDAYEMIFGDGRFVAVQNGGIARSSDLIDINNHVPASAAMTLPSPATARSLLELTATATDADSDALTYVWDFGTAYPLLEGNDVFKSFSVGGTYPVTLRVYDGKSSPATVTQNLVVTDPLSTWTQRTITPNTGITDYGGDFQAIASGGGRIVAVGSLFSGAFKGPVAVSTNNGSTWTGYQLPLNGDLYALTYDGTRFIGCGQMYGFDGTAGWRSYIATSTDGITWTTRLWANNGKEQRAIAWNGSAGSPVYLSAGSGGSLYRSTDSVNWTPVTTTTFLPSAATLGGLAYGNGTFVLTSTYNTGTTQRVFVSTDGLVWTDVSAGSGIAADESAGVEAAYLNNRFLISGNGPYTTSSPKLRVSTDSGQTFTTTRPVKEVIEGFAYGSGLYFGAGTDVTAGNYLDTNVVSTDGVTWYQFASPTTDDRHGATFANGTFLTAGNALSLWQSGTIPDASGYPQWQSGYFPTGSGGLLDPDKDGVPNYLEYGFGLVPTSNARPVGTLPIPALTTAGRRGATFKLPDPTPSDALYQIQVSTDLQQWTPIARKVGPAAWQWTASGPSQLEQDAASGGKRVLRCGVPNAQASAPKVFMRVTVAVP